MKTCTRVLGVLALVGALLIAAFIGVVELQSRQSLRELKQLVVEFAPGTPFTHVVQRLGSPAQTHRAAQDMAVFGTRTDASLLTNSVLHMFIHRGPPYRWVLIYTDRESQRIVHANWKDM